MKAQKNQKSETSIHMENNSSNIQNDTNVTTNHNISNLSNKDVMDFETKKQAQKHSLEQALSSAQMLTESNFVDNNAWMRYLQLMQTEKTSLMWKSNQTINSNIIFRVKKRHKLLKEKYERRMKTNIVARTKVDTIQSRTKPEKIYQYKYKTNLKRAIGKSKIVSAISNNFDQASTKPNPNKHGVYKKTVHNTWILDTEAMNKNKHQANRNRSSDLYGHSKSITPAQIVDKKMFFQELRKNTAPKDASHTEMNWKVLNQPFMSLKIRHTLPIPAESRFHRFERTEIKSARTVVNAVTRLNSDVVQSELSKMTI